MAKNAPVGDGSRKGMVKRRPRAFNQWFCKIGVFYRGLVGVISFMALYIKFMLKMGDFVLI